MPLNSARSMVSPPESPRSTDLGRVADLINGEDYSVHRLQEACKEGEVVIQASNLPVVKKLGEGSFGIVFKCRYAAPRGSRAEQLVQGADGLVAVKRLKSPEEMAAFWAERGVSADDDTLPSSATAPKADISDEAIREFAHELLLLKKLSHPNVIGYIGCGIFKSEAGRDSLALVQEFAVYGSLKDQINSTKTMKRPYKVSEGLRWAQDIADGMAFLHNCKPKIVHRDLKPENILLCTAARVAKISDLGLASLAIQKRKDMARSGLMRLGNRSDEKPRPTYAMTGKTGSLRYMAPENFRGENYTHTVDQYSFAIILYELLWRGPAYKDLYLQPEMIAKAVAGPRQLRPELPKVWPKPVVDLISECWAEDASRRPDFMAVLERIKAIRCEGPEGDKLLDALAAGTRKGILEKMGVSKAA